MHIKMGTKDKRIDAYISKAQPFAQPILIKLRELVHNACPDVIETIKWGMPSFDYQGPMFNFAAFKAHCVGNFWKAALLEDPKGLLGLRKNQGGEAMGNFGRITSIKDLPSDKEIISFIKQHMKLNEAGLKLERKPLAKKELIVPPELIQAFSKNKKAKTVFENFSVSHQREYCEWIMEAKTEPTKNKRITSTLEMLEEGKSRNWKYAKK
jgi:uncharacterized protein YdeI (YjbR/CyaY-like superfamily)